MTARPPTEIVVTGAAEVGFLIAERGTVVAALTTRAEVAHWIEHRLAAGDGPPALPAEPSEGTEAMPNVVQGWKWRTR